MSSDAIIIIATGSLIAATCALLGSFLILRKSAMLADAISHAVLPGIVIAYLISENRNSLPLMMGAALAGLLSTYFIEWLKTKLLLQEDASIGITFTSLFALGIILISAYTGQVDLDQDCVLYGEIGYAPLNRILLSSGLDLGPRALWIASGLLVLSISFILLFYKRLKITSFHPEYAASIGISVWNWQFSFMAIVSITTVMAFELVGAILIVALLVVPAASAYLLTRRLPIMLVISVILGALSAFTGYYLAYFINSSIAGSMVLCSGFFFLASLLISKVST